MMNCCRIEKSSNATIDKWLREKKCQDRKKLNLLLLGTRGSGKSTFIKQMEIIHGQGYSDNERKSCIRLIYQNILMSMNSLIDAMEVLEIDYEKGAESARNAALIRSVAGESESLQSLLQWKHIVAIAELWADQGVQQCFERWRQYQLTDSAKYYLDDLERIAAPGYSPTLQDILRVRVPTMGIIEYPLNVGGLTYYMVEVGGQRGERRKWIHLFDDVTLIIFMTALSEYDVADDYYGNRLEESLDLFKSTISYPWFDKTSVLLLLNKKDVFEEKIAHSHIGDYFPDYDGPRRDAHAACEFILAKFLWLIPDPKKIIYAHSICATDPKNATSQFVFADAKDAFLQKNLRQYKII